MKSLKSAYIALLAALILVAGSTTIWAQAAQQSGDQSSNASSAEKKSKKKQKVNVDRSAAAPTVSITPANEPPAPAASTPASTPSGSTPAPKPTTAGQIPAPKDGGTVWVNTDSGVYHKPGSRWYGKTRHGKYMMEADAKKAGFREAKKERAN